MSPLNGRRLLFLSPLLAMPSQHGGCVYPHALLSHLHRLGLKIDYGWTGAPLFGGRRWMRNPLSADYVATSWIRDSVHAGDFLLPSTLRGWLGRPEPLPFDPRVNGGEHPATAAERRFAARLVRRLRPRDVLVDSTPMLTLLDDLSPSERAGLRVAVLTHNLNSRRTDLYRQFGRPLDFLPVTRSEESTFLARADVVIAIQEREAESFREMLPGRTVLTVPMPQALHPQPAASEKPGRCLFVGGYSGHNIEAVRWVLSEVWPSVRAALPQAELAIAGTVGRSVTTPPAGVLVLGPVERLEQEYAAAQVCLVPLPLGTGLKIKLIEAMGFGRAVLTTPAGAEGFADLEAGSVAVVAGEAGRFASELVSLLSSADQRASVVKHQLDWLGHHMNPDAALAGYVEVLRS